MRHIFEVVNAHYDTDENLGIVSGNVVKSNIHKIIKICNLAKRKK